jgi:hypothetical protein
MIAKNPTSMLVSKVKDRNKLSPSEFLRTLPLHPEEIDCFWDMVDKAGPDDCWPWTWHHLRDGYGVVHNLSLGTIRHLRAHQLAYRLKRGLIPEGMSVLHRCDNPPCCNPAHLFVGTHDDNMRDMVIKGRSRRGEDHGRAKITEDIVRDIRRRYDAGEQILSIARDIHLSPTATELAVKRKTWRHVL